MWNGGRTDQQGNFWIDRGNLASFIRATSRNSRSPHVGVSKQHSAVMLPMNTVVWANGQSVCIKILVKPDLKCHTV